MYKIVKGSEGVRKEFKISCGLRAGYGKYGKKHTLKKAEKIILNWMKKRAAEKKSYITGTVYLGEGIYVWPCGKGQADGRNEPSVIFSGEISTLYNKDLKDDEIKELLNSLASALGDSLRQTRIYVVYHDFAWILQAEGTTTPTGECV